jgi:hypothetical protein
MGFDATVDDQMKGTRSLTERVAMYIPFYRGYREKNLRRDEDRAVREEVARTLEGTKADLATIQRAVLNDVDLMRDVERIRTKVDKYAVGIRKAVNGYSGIWASVKVLEKELDAVIEWDAKLLEGSAKIRTDAQGLLDYIDSGGMDLKKPIRDFERMIDTVIEEFTERDKVIKGFAGDGATTESE